MQGIQKELLLWVESRVRQTASGLPWVRGGFTLRASSCVWLCVLLVSRRACAKSKFLRWRQDDNWKQVAIRPDAAGLLVQPHDEGWARTKQPPIAGNCQAEDRAVG